MVNSLLLAVRALSDVMLLVLFAVLLFAIVGQQLFVGRCAVIVALCLFTKAALIRDAMSWQVLLQLVNDCHLICIVHRGSASEVCTVS